jgi:hypothetical protein
VVFPWLELSGACLIVDDAVNDLGHAKDAGMCRARAAGRSSPFVSIAVRTVGMEDREISRSQTRTRRKVSMTDDFA